MKNIVFEIRCETADDWGGFEKFYGTEIENENSLVYYVSMKDKNNARGYLNNEISAYFHLGSQKFFDLSVENGAILSEWEIFFTKKKHAIKVYKKLIKLIEKKYPNKYNFIIQN